MVIESFGNAYIVGEVQNTGGGVATFVSVRATVATAGGTTTPLSFVRGPAVRRMTRTGFASSASLAAGETGCFRISTTVPLSQLTVLALDASQTPTPVGAAASRYLAEHTDGTVPCRFDLALVDRLGRIERIENARSFDDW